LVRYLQKSRSTTDPRRSARVSSRPPVFSQARPFNSGARTRGCLIPPACQGVQRGVPWVEVHAAVLAPAGDQGDQGAIPRRLTRPQRVAFPRPAQVGRTYLLVRSLSRRWHSRATDGRDPGNTRGRWPYTLAGRAIFPEETRERWLRPQSWSGAPPKSSQEVSKQAHRTSRATTASERSTNADQVTGHGDCGRGVVCSRRYHTHCHSAGHRR
jgi:hypothetical protein